MTDQLDVQISFEVAMIRRQYHEARRRLGLPPVRVADTPAPIATVRS